MPEASALARLVPARPFPARLVPHQDPVLLALLWEL